MSARLKAFAAFDFRGRLKPSNRGIRWPGGTWVETTGGGTFYRAGSHAGGGVASGSGTLSFGNFTRMFDGFSPANSPCWFALVIRHGAYVNQGSSRNTIFRYGSVTSSNGFAATMLSDNTLELRASDTALYGPVLMAGNIYRIVWGRDAIGSCWAWVNGQLVAAGISATAADSATARIVEVLGDETTTRYYKGSVHLLAFGSDNPREFGSALSRNPFQLFDQNSFRTYSVPGLTPAGDPVPEGVLQYLYPNGLVSQSNLIGAYTDIDDDPASPDNNWLTVA